MSEYTIRKSIVPDVSQLKANLRQPDLDEIDALGWKPRTAIMFGYLNGECYTGLKNGKVLCMYGVVPESTGGRIWMLSCTGIEKHALPVTRIAKTQIKHFSDQFNNLYNIVDERNQITIRWLKCLGFKLGATHLVGSTKKPFKEFVAWRSH